MSQQPNSRRAAQAGQPGGPKRIVTPMATEHHKLNRPAVVPLDERAAHELALGRPLPAQGQATQPKPEPKTQAETSAAYQTVGLPSGCLFYEFKSVSVRSLRAAEKAKLYNAATNNSLRSMVEAISATLGDGVSAMDLTPQDFYFLMYWQRLNSLLKNPMIVRASCNDDKHNQDVFAGYEEQDESGKVVRKFKDEKTLDLEVRVNSTTLKTTYLELTEIDRSQWPALEHLDLHIETMRDIVEASEELTNLDNLTEIEYLAGFAAFLRRRDEKDTLLKRIERISDLELDAISEFEDYMKVVTTYGVSESADITCPECRASNKVLIPFDARTFL